MTAGSGKAKSETTKRRGRPMAASLTIAHCYGAIVPWKQPVEFGLVAKGLAEAITVVTDNLGKVYKP